MKDAMSLYEPLDVTPPTIPTRSRLYCLEPIGIGTPYVESLTSYVNRLARAHYIQPRRLMVQEVHPLLGLLKSISVNKSINEEPTSAFLNGMTPLTGGCIQVLSALTGCENLRFLSMLTWTNIASQVGVVRNTRAWCPVCYDEWIQAGKIVYEPLLWNIKAVTRCSLHNQNLLDHCPQRSCQQRIPLLTSLSHYCPKCESSLAMPVSRVSMSVPSIDKPNDDIQRWSVDGISTLLSVAPTLSTVPSKDRITTGITLYISHALSGSEDMLADKLGIKKQQLMEWQRGIRLPKFSTLLTMCFYMNISPMHFLTGDIESCLLAQSPVQVNSILKASQMSGPMDKESLHEAFMKMLEEVSSLDLSLPIIARKLGYPVSTLRHYFPEQCQSIEKYLLQRKNTDYSQSLEAFLIDAEHPTLNEIARRLGCPVTTLKYRYPEMCRMLAKQNQRVLDISKIHEMLQKAIQCKEASFPTVSEISKHFECSVSVLYYHFSGLCYELTKKQKDNKPKTGSPELLMRSLNSSKSGAVSDVPKRSFRSFSTEDMNRMRQELERLLESGSERSYTMTELASYFKCARHTLRSRFPELCDKLTKKREKEEYISELRQVLEKVLIEDVSPVPSVNQLARQLECSSAMLRQYFPDLCQSISRRYMGLNEIGIQRSALEEIILHNEETNLSINEIARRLKCSNSTLYSRFPDLCEVVVKRRWKAVDVDGIRRVLEAMLANDNELPLTLKELSESLGCSAKNLEYYFPEECRAITARRQKLGVERFKPQLEEILAENIPVSVEQVARRLNCSALPLRQHFPELCKAISGRYRAYRKEKSLELEESICDEVRKIVYDLHAQGDYPGQNKVIALVSRPGHFWRLKVRETWLNAVRSLGLRD